MTKKEREEAREDSIHSLRKAIYVGDTVYTSLSHVSRSGMMRHIDVYIVSTRDRDGAHVIRRISWEVARILGYKQVENGTALKVGGCGMDMGYHLVYGLSRTLWPDGHACLGINCPSNDHSNGETRKLHPDGGYALRHEWL